MSEIFKVTLDQLVYGDFDTGEISVSEEPYSVYVSNETEESPGPSSLLRLVLRLETELHELKERIKREAPDLAKEWGIK